MWLGVLPLAVLPLWQLEHWLATGICVWFQVEGFHVTTVWQAMQFAVVGMWVAVLPRALVPLWQPEQLVAALNRLWSGRADIQLTVERWQSPQLVVTPACTGVMGLPVATTPLWQVPQRSRVTPMWLKRAPVKLTVLWQVSHVACVGRCCGGITTLLPASRAPRTWQLAQSRGVPRKAPCWWQSSQRAPVCMPVSGKPLFAWSAIRDAALCAN